MRGILMPKFLDHGGLVFAGPIDFIRMCWLGEGNPLPDHGHSLKGGKGAWAKKKKQTKSAP